MSKKRDYVKKPQGVFNTPEIQRISLRTKRMDLETTLKSIEKTKAQTSSAQKEFLENLSAAAKSFEGKRGVDYSRFVQLALDYQAANDANIKEYQKRLDNLSASMQPLAAALFFGELSINPITRQVFVREEQVKPMGPRKFRLIEYLAKNPDRPLETYELFRYIYPTRQPPTTEEELNRLYALVHSLRENLSQAGARREYIKTVQGFGYMLSSKK